MNHFASLALGAVLSLALALPQFGPASAQQVQAPPSAGLAQSDPELHAMLQALGIYDVIAIMANENIQGAADLEDELFPGEGGAAWQATATRLHAADRLVTLFEAALPRDALSPDDVAAITAFFSDGPGRGLVAGEVTTRSLFLDEDNVALANEAFVAAVEDGNPRLDMLERFNTANDLVERNVQAALNASFALYRGLSDAGAFDVEVPEDLMLAEVWAQEPELRRSTIEWLYAYQLAAYSTASDADLDAYIAFSQTDAGQTLNSTLFTAFDDMFAQLSYDLGSAAAIFITGEDI